MVKHIKKCLVRTMRLLIGAREHERVVDALYRKKSKLLKKIDRRRYTIKTLCREMDKLQIGEGIRLLVHCSWRNLYNYSGTPEDVIHYLMEKIGERGTLLMPSYVDNIKEYDVNNTKTSAGVLAETFRTKFATIRSECCQATVCAAGLNAKELLEEHRLSRYAFDKQSPFYKLTQDKNAYVLFIGLGKNPTKNSLFHCVAYNLRNELPQYRNLYKRSYQSNVVLSNGDTEVHEMVACDGHNNNVEMKRIVRLIPKKYIWRTKINGQYFVLYKADEAYLAAVERAKKGYSLYRNIK